MWKIKETYLSLCSLCIADIALQNSLDFCYVNQIDHIRYFVWSLLNQQVSQPFCVQFGECNRGLKKNLLYNCQCLLHKFTQKHKLTEQLQGHMYSNSKQFTICFSTLWTLVSVAIERNSWDEQLGFVYTQILHLLKQRWRSVQYRINRWPLVLWVNLGKENGPKLYLLMN